MGGLRIAPTYIYRHNSSYIFRIAIPRDISPHLNKKEYRYSLKTGSLSVAKFRARVIVSMIQTLFKDIRRGGRMAELTDKEINQIIRDYIKRWLDNDEKGRAERPPADWDHLHKNEQSLDWLIPEFKQDLAMSDYHHVKDDVEIHQVSKHFTSQAYGYDVTIFLEQFSQEYQLYSTFLI